MKRWLATLPAVLAIVVLAVVVLHWRRDRVEQPLRTGTDSSPASSIAPPAQPPADVPHPLSAEAYRAELRYLRGVYRGIDLSGPPVKTDGWRRNIPEAEWPFMGMCYFAMACCQLAQADPGIRDEALAEARYCVAALQTPRMTGFIAEHFGPPFGEEPTGASAFVHGLFLNAAARYREASGDEQSDPVVRRVAAALAAAYQKDEQALLPSYPGMWWLGDNLMAMGGLARCDRVYGGEASKAKDKMLASIRRHYLDEATGLFATYVDPAQHRVIQGPRGICITYGLHFLRDYAPEFAADQYARAKRHLIRTGLGVGAVLETPPGQEFSGDVDSGPVLFGLGLSASGFAIPAAATHGDREAALSLLRASVLAGAPRLEDGKLRYATMPTVGQSVILFGKALLLSPAEAATLPPPK